MTEVESWRLCPKFETAIDILGKRWTGLIIEVLLNGAVRFSDMAQRIPELSDRMLVQRLKELEKAQVVTRRVYPEMPVRIEYALTQKGRDLAPVVEAIHRWADAWCKPDDSRRTQAP